MRITGLALVPPPSAADLPRVTPELLASVLARYSRSNEGIHAILDKVDPADPDASIDRILKFVDYGHASIGGLTGGLAIALDDVSMWLAYKVFEIAQMADGQESSTRYITLAPSALPDPAELGVPAELAPRWREVMARAFAAYQAEYTRLDTLALAEPERVRVPAGAKPAVIARIRKNYALDRARYFIPLATRTNLALVQTSRMWAQTVKHLASLPQPEARAAADLIRGELLKISPRLMRHSTAETSHQTQAAAELATSCRLGLARLSCRPLADETWVHVDRATPPFLTEEQSVPDALSARTNRYGHQGSATRRMRVSFAWNNLALAELRDLNRHRTGHRYTPLIQAGFYLPRDSPRRPPNPARRPTRPHPRTPRRRLARLRLLPPPRRPDALRALHPRGQVHLRGRAAHRPRCPLPLRRTPFLGPRRVFRPSPRSPLVGRRRHRRARITLLQNAHLNAIL